MYDKISRNGFRSGSLLLSVVWPAIVNPFLTMSLWYLHPIHPLCPQTLKPLSLSIPVLSNHDIIPTHHPLLHFPILVKRPMLDPIASLPFHFIHGILILIPELHGDSVVLEGEELFPK